jgi:heat shock protein HtpX
MEIVKTTFLLTFLTVLFVFVGAMVGGQSGVVIAFLFAAGMNFYAYFFSSSMVLKRYNAVEVDRQSASGLVDIVAKIAQRAQIPMPKVYIIPDSTPNAFATGRNPQNGVVAVTEGLLELLEVEEVEAVIAHEIGHVRHYDILTGTIAATIAGAIAMLANMMQFGAMFGGRDDNRGGNPILMIVMSILLPVAASIIQMSISRSREFAADRAAAELTGHPEWLQSSLQKLENYAKRGASIHNATPETAHMFIINPFRSRSFDFKSLFSTHPSTADRIARLEEIKREFAR